MMKRYNILMLALGALLAGCGNEDVPAPEYSSEAILFTSPYTVSRSALRYGAFETGDQVGVLGYCRAINAGEDFSESPWDTKRVFCTPDVFYNHPLTYAGDGAWNYTWTGTGSISGLHPWYDNENYTYAFFAYYPYVELGRNNSGTIPNSGGTLTISGEDVKNNPVITFTMPYSEDNNRPNRDLNWEGVPDFMLANRVDHVKKDGAVALNFRHLFAAFEFEINNFNAQEVEIEELKVQVENAYREVSVTGQASDYVIGGERDENGKLTNPDTYGGTFNVLKPLEDENKTFTCPAAHTDTEGNVTAPYTLTITKGGVNENGEAQGDPIDLLFIPNEENKLVADVDNGSFGRPNAGAATVIVRLKVGDKEREGSMDLLNSSSTFIPGTRSIFSINIVGNDIVLQMRTVAWEEGGNADIHFD